MMATVTVALVSGGKSASERRCQRPEPTHEADKQPSCAKDIHEFASCRLLARARNRIEDSYLEECRLASWRVFEGTWSAFETDEERVVKPKTSKASVPPTSEHSDRVASI